jgi:autotransporter translocation and assembly factor TamB
VIGTSHDPHFAGSVNIVNAAFLATATGARYKNGRAAITLARERVTVDTFHIEDNDGHPLEVRGSLGTHELHVGDLEIEARAQRFEVMRNQLGRVVVNAALQVRGQFESPRIAGDVTISSADVKVDEILQRTLFQPYATEPTPIGEVDAVAALNPWERLGLDISLHVPNTLRLTGRDVQISSGTPIGLGDINLRVLGDLYLYKDPQQPLSVTGSFDRITGTYTFQGRRFDVVDTSSINFRGDLNPEVYVTVRRQISGVETRVAITGPLRQPELHLSSTPPLDDSDILSLIVFNTSSNELTAAQIHRDTSPQRDREPARIRGARGRGPWRIRRWAESDDRRGNPAGSGGALQPAVRAGSVRRSHARVHPHAHPAAARHVLGCTDADRPLALPAHRARRHRPVVLLQLLTVTAAAPRPGARGPCFRTATMQTP